MIHTFSKLVGLGCKFEYVLLVSLLFYLSKENHTILDMFRRNSHFQSKVFPYEMALSKEQRNQLKLLLRQICLAVCLSTRVRPQKANNYKIVTQACQKCY